MQYLKKLIYIVTVSLAFTHQALANKPSSMIRAGVAHQDSTSYFYAGILAQLGYASLNNDHPSLALYEGSAFSNAGVMLGLLLGRKWMRHFATELTFEWLLNYAGTKSSLFASELIKTDLSFYTLGVGLDAMPMLPVSDSISLLGLLGIGYKSATIKAKKKEILDSIGWKGIPRIGLGVFIDADCCSVVLKLLMEFNNRFKDPNKEVFRPSVMFGTSMAFNFR